jgi:hypothetical protein
MWQGSGGMARQDIKQLYEDLTQTQFTFVPSGVYPLSDVYQRVQAQFPTLCDDTYLCSQNCTNGYNSPEWRHTVRTALNILLGRGLVSHGPNPTEWQFT